MNSSAQVWIGQAHVVPGSHDGSWRESFRAAEGGYTWALALAANESEFRHAVRGIIEEEGWILRDVDDVSLFSTAYESQSVPEEIEEARQELLESGEPQLTTFYLYRPPDYTPDEDWSNTLGDAGLGSLQLEIARHLQRMTQQFELPFLEGISVVRDEGVEFILHHGDDEAVDLSITVAEKDLIVDYLFGHAHFHEDDGEDWLDEALSFVASALQGGVKVELWETHDEPVASRTWVLADDGDWMKHSTTIHRTLDFLKRRSRPDDTIVLSYRPLP
jgi:hypothetical protein